MIFFCSVCVLLFFIKGKVKPHHPKGIFVLASYFYACFGMSGRLDVILGDKIIQDELILTIIIAFAPLIFLGFKKSEFKIPKIKTDSQLRYLSWIKYTTIIIGTLGFFYQLQKLGGLDVLVNNAGVNVDNLSLRMKDEEWKKVIDINLTSTFLLSKYAIKRMLKSKFGRVVNITSIVGHTGNLGQTNYSASKAGIIGMSKSLAIEYAKKNITVNCVSPGFIVSDMTMNIAEKVKLFLTSRIPMGKLGTGEDVSNCVAFLSSDSASYVTGETIHVNGGMYMS